jgi:hypothetical protein
MPIAWVSAESSTIPEQPPIEVAGCSGYTCHDEQDAMDAVWVVSTERRPMCHRLVEDDARSERHEYRIAPRRTTAMPMTSAAATIRAVMVGLEPPRFLGGASVRHRPSEVLGRVVLFSTHQRWGTVQVTWWGG